MKPTELKIKLENDNQGVSRNQDYSVDREAERKCCEVFPVEIWEQIFHKLSNPADREAMNNSNLFFRKIFGHMRPTFLFGNVWKVLPESYKKLAIYEERSLGFESVPAVRRLRLVCKDWCMGLDKYYDKKYLESLNRIGETTVKHGYKGSPWGDNSFRVVRRFVDFFEMSHGVGTDRNPVLSRQLILPHPTNDANDIQQQDTQLYLRYYESVTQLLCKYGQHIWKLEIQIKDQLSTSLEFFSKILEWLAMVPNLKLFILNCGHILPARRGRSEVFIARELRELRVNRNWPVLNQLKHMKFENAPSEIVQMFVSKYDDQIEVLRCDNPIDWDTVKLPKLRQLHVDIAHPWDLDHFEKLANPGWSISSIGISMRFEELFPPNYALSRFLSFLQNWNESLTYVFIRVPWGLEPEEDLNIKCYLPYIERFVLHEGRDDFTNDLLYD